MIRLKVIDLLEKDGKSKYWLYRQLGMSYGNFHKMINNETKSIRYEMIESLCVLFKCTPNDIFEYDFEQLPENSTLKEKNNQAI